MRYAEMLVNAAPHDSEALELAALGKQVFSLGFSLVCCSVSASFATGLSKSLVWGVV